MEKLLNALSAIERQHGFKSERALARHLKISHTYLRALKDGTQSPSPDLLALILDEAKQRDDVEVLRAVRAQQKGKARAVIDKAIKALSAAALVLPLMFGVMLTASHYDATAAVTSLVPNTVYYGKLFLLFLLVLAGRPTGQAQAIAPPFASVRTQCYRFSLPSPSIYATNSATFQTT